MRAPRLNPAHAPGEGGATARREAEEVAARLPPLLVAAERVASTVAQGVHGRRRVGQGETFWQFRRYQPGDPAQAIDWRQSAKSQPLYVRETEWEAAQSVWLWRDASPSMRYHSNNDLPEKFESATILTLALTSLLIRGGERVALLGGGVNPSSGRAVLDRFVAILARPNEEEPSLPPLEVLPRYARVVMMGDFLSPLADIDRVVRGFTATGVRGQILQVIDPAEETLPFAGRIRFSGLEGEDDNLISRVESVRREYAARMDDHRAGLAALARASGWGFAHHRTDRPPQSALLALHLALSERPGG